MQNRVEQGQYTADTMKANFTHWVVDNKESSHRQKSGEEWRLTSEILVSEGLMGMISGRHSHIWNLCVILAQRPRHRAPAPSKF
eukprot:1694791-Heterocapsa_arctica.AAC.1